MEDPDDQATGRIGAVILDMDGVVTDTADVHFIAWKDTFDEVLRHHDARPFSRDDYLAHVDGLPRFAGVRRFLSSRGIDLPEGAEDDMKPESVRGIGNLKNARFRAWLEENEVPVFADAKAFIAGLRHAGIKVGVFSASRNAKAVLRSAGVAQDFDATVDGADAGDLGLKPKPEADQLIETARRLGCAPGRTAVIEDAVAGVAAGSSGRFGLVIGVDRQDDSGAHRHHLRANGADIVTGDLGLLLPGGEGLKTLDRMPLLWDRLDEIRERLGNRRLAVFLDFDGTLSPIVADYRDAVLPEATKAALERLAARVCIVVISGRDLADVRDRVGNGGIIYAGSHGFDIAGPDGLRSTPREAEGFGDALDAAEAELRESLSGIDGAGVERKAFSIAVHFRQAADNDLASIEDAVDEVAARHETLRKSRGKKVVEIQPRTEWDKGRALEWMLASTPIGQGGLCRSMSATT